MWTFPQTEAVDKPGYLTVHGPSHMMLSVQIVEARFVYIDIPERGLLEGESMTLVYGETAGGGPGARSQYLASDQQNQALFICDCRWSSKDGFVPLTGPVALEVVPDAPTRLVLIAPADAKVGEASTCTVMVQDKWGNLVKDYKGRVDLHCAMKASFPSSVVFDEEAGGKVVTKFVPLEEGTLRIEGEEPELGLRGCSNPISCSALGNNLKVYFGDLHHHTTISDGMCSIDKVYKTLRDVACFDFAAAIDHDYHHPHILYEHGMEITDEDWELIKAKADEYYERGRFVTFVGYEWTGPKEPKDPGRGDMNVYYLEPGGLYRRCEPGSDVHESVDLWKKLRKHLPGVITVTHHSASGWGRLGSDWDSRDDEMQPLVEIYSSHGASEYYDNPWPPVRLRVGGHVQEALAQGYRFGFIGGSDCHSLNLNSPNVISGSPFPPLLYQGGLAAVLSKDLSREAIFAALKMRRTYATTGERILLHFTVAGHLMGEEIKVSEPNLKIAIAVSGTCELKTVELLRNNEVVMSVGGGSRDLEMELNQDIAEGDRAFFYVRVTQVDGSQAWSSPVWVERTKD